MMVQKARLFGDEGIAKNMLDTTDPKEHKALGRLVEGFDDGKWDESMYLPTPHLNATPLLLLLLLLLHTDVDCADKLRIVEEGNYHKFTISEDAAALRSMLLATGERQLVEASPLDKIWGVGFGEKNAEKNRHKWGQNLLGIALMDVRTRLRDEAGRV